jgi:hypothetical protein
VLEVITDYNTTYTFSFGGTNDYCFIASMSSPDYIPYIDRVEYGEKCIKTAILSKSGGTVKLVKTALWTMFKLFPHITHFNLQDESYIYCMENSKQFKLRLAYDMIIKYNKTWYEYHFGAVLPEDKYNHYKQLLTILDTEQISFDDAIKNYTYIKPYEAEWKSSHSPREFIQQIKKTYGTEQYCYKLGKWLDSFFEDMGINIFNTLWQIPSTHLVEPESYELFTSTVNMRGGNKLQKTLKRTKYRIKKNCGHSIGYVNSYDTN